tara:strand:- start:2534 stop:2974 length:441 start_codon:yes stop_codon:yes gene_type:complete
MNKQLKGFIKDSGGRYKYFPLTTKKHKVGDCVIRAISIASGLDYKKVMTDLFERGLALGRLPNTQKVYEPYLEELGFVKQKPQYNVEHDEATDDEYLRKRRMKDVLVDYNKSYIFLTSQHLTAVVNGEHRDVWNCGAWCANSYYVK